MRRLTYVVVVLASVGLASSAHAQTVPFNASVLRVAAERTAARRPFAPGNGVSWPTATYMAKPVYTTEAMRAKIQGAVELKMVVRADGTVGDVTVVKSLDTQFGLDVAAIEAAKKWRFTPGMKDGKPVATLVSMSLEFRMSKR